MHHNIDIQRKDDHIELNLNQNVQSDLSNGFEKIRFIHNALPELDYNDIQTNIKFFGKKLQAPIIISSMTGGTENAKEINNNLAKAAQRENIAMALGSMRAFLADPNTLGSFSVRSVAPDILLLVNIGAVQLNYGITPKDCQHLIDSAEANGLILHLNVLQELLQPEGNKNWKNLLCKIKEVINYVSVPVIVKEVGYGLSAQVAQTLIKCGIYALDIAGAGGTSWSQVESYRANNEMQQRIAKSFIDWGIPTARSLQMVRAASATIPIIASGGIKSGIEGAKAIRLGADIFGLAQPFLKAATLSAEAVQEEVQLLTEQLKICMCCTGSHTLADLKQAEIEVT